VVPLRTPTLPPATHTNCVLIGHDDGLIVVDPASPYEEEQARLLETVQERGAVRAIWLTHHHLDHVGGVEALRASLDVPVRAHPATAKRLEGVIAIDEPLFEGDYEDLGHGLVLDALHTPGHARGHLAFRDRERRTVVAGDLVAGQGTIVIDPPEGDMADYLTTLARLVVDGLGAVIPAHGPHADDGEAKILELIAHREAREKQILETLAAQPGRRARSLDLAATIYPQVPTMFHPLAARQILAHLLKLEREGAVDRPDGSKGVPGVPVYMAAWGAPAAPEPHFRAI
jgi:glyoxylase-like metal-dependent hydrolase (beta-lactamase superfamily II)